MQILCFDQKINKNLVDFYICILSPGVESTTFIPSCDRQCHYATSMLSGWQPIRNFVIYRGDWLSIKFCENNSFRKQFFSKVAPVFRKYLSVSRWNLPGYFSVSCRFPQVTEFGKSTAIYLADSCCQLYSSLWSAWQEDPNDPQERCAMARTSCAWPLV